MQTCTYKGLTFVTTAPGVFNSTSQSRNFSRIVNADGPVQFQNYIDTALNTYRSTWRICSWHKNQKAMQTGTKEDETGWEVYQMCLQHGATIMTGHEHTYSRTFLMKSLGAGMQGTPQGNTMAMDGEGRPIGLAADVNSESRRIEIRDRSLSFKVSEEIAFARHNTRTFIGRRRRICTTALRLGGGDDL